jgi:predicted transcriptional regulator
MIVRPNEQKAKIYDQLMFRFQRVQEQIKNIKTGNVISMKDTPQKLNELKRQLSSIVSEIKRLQ